MPKNSQGLYASVDDLPDAVHAAIGDSPHKLRTFRAAFNAARTDPKYDEGSAYAVAWAAVGHHAEPKTPQKVFAWLPQNKRAGTSFGDDPEQEGGKDREAADVENPNAASPMEAEAASQGDNTTNPMEDSVEAHMEEERRPTVRPTTRSKPPAAL